MERLSNIIRTGQGPHMAAHQRLQQPPAQGQRQPMQPRRPLPEQSGRSGVSAHSSGLYSTRLPYEPEAHDEQWEEPARPRSRATYGSQRVPRIPQTGRYTEQPPQGDYYEEDERSTVVPADVQEEWSDDTAGMRYGDWESAPGYAYSVDYQEEEEEYELPAPRYGDTNPAPRQPEQEISQVAQRLAQLHNRNNPLATRQLYRITPENAQPASARELREARLPVPATSSQLTPARQGQRTTQPLKPRQMARVSNEMRQHQITNASHEEDGEPTIYIPPPYKSPVEICPICKGAGYLRQDVPYGHPGFGKPVQCECKRKELKTKQRQKRQEEANLRSLNDKRFSNFIVDNAHFQLREAYQIAREYAKNPNGWLVFMGKPGCGKTHLAAAIANQCVETGAKVYFITVSDLLDHLRAAFNPSSDITYDSLFNTIREVELLVLDDLGAQKSSPWANEKLFQLINYRYNYRMPTVITTNLTPGQAVIDDRIRSRMNDFSFVTLINLDRVRDYRPNNPRRD